jgi:hypothetical protein
MRTTFDKNAGQSDGVERVWGFGWETAIANGVYMAPGAKRFFVDPNNAQATDAGNHGEDPTVPLATVAAAVTLCRAYRGDTIFIAPNDGWQYAAGQRPVQVVESVTIPYTKGGIRIVGTGPNPLACTWSPAANNGVALTVHATDVLVENIGFYTGFTGCTGIMAEWDGVTDYGENLTVKSCHFDAGLDYGIQLDYSWYNQIVGCLFDNIQIAAIFSMDVAGDPDYCFISGCDFLQCTAAIDLEDTDDCVIHANRIIGNPAGAANYIDLTGGATNLVSDNWLGCTLAQYTGPGGTCDDATSGHWLNNHCLDGDTVSVP